jgi:predicted AAA+ superfamily ATPase
LRLSITRDSEKMRALLTLLKGDGFKKYNSILIYATQKRTTE